LAQITSPRDKGNDYAFEPQRIRTFVVTYNKSTDKDGTIKVQKIQIEKKESELKAKDQAQVQEADEQFDVNGGTSGNISLVQTKNRDDTPL